MGGVCYRLLMKLSEQLVRVHSLLPQYGSPRSNSCEYWWQGPLLTEIYCHSIYFILNDNNWQNKN